MFKNWDWSDVWMAFLLLIAITGASLIVTSLVNRHDVDYYYLSSQNSSSGGFCVYAHWTWHGDEKAYCTDDVSKALDFALKANSVLKERPKSQ